MDSSSRPPPPPPPDEDGGRQGGRGNNHHHHTRKRPRVSSPGAGGKILSSPSSSSSVVDEEGTIEGTWNNNNSTEDRHGSAPPAAVGDSINNTIVYKIPTVKEQRHFRECFRQISFNISGVYDVHNLVVFHFLFREPPDPAFVHVAPISSRWNLEQYDNIPERDKWWKDDEVYILKSFPKFVIPADILKLVSNRLRSEPTFIADVLRTRVKQLVMDDETLTEKSRMMKKTEEVVDETLSHCDILSTLYDDELFFYEIGRLDFIDFDDTWLGDISYLEERCAKEYFIWYHVIFFILGRASPRLKDDADFQKDVFFGADFHPRPGSVLEHASDRLKDDPDFIISTIGRDKYHGALDYASERLRNDKRFLMRVQKELLDPKFQDRDEYAGVLDFASERLCDDKGFVQTICSLTDLVEVHLMSDRLRNDKSFLLKVIEITGDYTFLYNADNVGLCEFVQRGNGPPTCCDDFDIVRACIRACKVMPDERSGQHDDEVLMTWNRCPPLGFASERLRDNEDLVKIAIAKNPLWIYHASARLRSDESMALFALETLRDCPPGLPRFVKGGYIRAACHLFSRSFSLSLRRNGVFVSKALMLVPYVRYAMKWYDEDVAVDVSPYRIGVSGTTWYEDDDLNALAIALGSGPLTINGRPVPDFWSHRFGREFGHEKLVEFWKSMTAAHRKIEAFDKELLSITNEEDDLLRVGLDRRMRRKKRYDGFDSDTCFSLADWNRQKWYRVWLVDQRGRAVTHRQLPGEVLKRIVRYTGIDRLLKKSSQVEKFEPLLSKLVERNLVMPEPKVSRRQS